MYVFMEIMYSQILATNQYVNVTFNRFPQAEVCCQQLCGPHHRWRRQQAVHGVQSEEPIPPFEGVVSWLAVSTIVAVNSVARVQISSK